ncbi:MAG: hypothetical protein PSV35_00550, partial [bacterium]|nr:hypothetical protein [bacterium]
ARFANNNTWLISPGSGTRNVFANHIWGLYGFADYQRTQPNARFWVINPGLEWMSPYLDAHINAYIPTQTQKKVGNPVFASSLGDFSKVRFSKHGQYDELFSSYISVGRGADSEVGYSFALKGYRARAFAGAYYYSKGQALTRNIKGGLAGIQLPLNNYADVLLTNAYDNINHNTVVLTLRVSFGENRSYSNDVHDRMLDRIERHVGIIATGAGSIAQKSFADTGNEGIFRDNIWFFNPTAPDVSSTTPNCTYEHPCTDFSQASVDYINTISANAYLYMSPGTYPLTMDRALNLHPGQSLSGRNNQFTSPATGNSRPLFTGALQVQGNNRLDSIRIVNKRVIVFNDLYFGQGLAALYLPQNVGSLPVWLNNTDLSTHANMGTAKLAGYSSALIANGGVLNMTHSNLSAENNATNMNTSVVIGMHLLGATQLNASHLVISATGAGRTAYGAIGFGNTLLKLDHSIVSSAMIQKGEAHGFELRDNSVADVNTSQINATSKGLAASGTVTNQQSQLNLITSKVLAMMNGNAGVSRGIYSRGASYINFKNSSIEATSTGARANGALAAQQSKIDINHSQLKASANSSNGSAAGIELYNSSKINVTNKTNINAISSGAQALGAVNIDAGQLTIKQSLIAVDMKKSMGEAQVLNLANSSQSTVDDSTLRANSSGIAYGAYMTNSSNLLVAHSHININSSANLVIGAYIQDSHFTMKNSDLSVNMTSSGHALGISSSGKGQSALFSSNIFVNSTGTHDYGLYLEDQAQAHISNNTSIIVNSSSGDVSIGAYLQNNTNLAVNNSSISASLDSGSGWVFATKITHKAKLAVNNGHLKAITKGSGDAYGLQSLLQSQAKITNKSVINVSSAGTNAFGLTSQGTAMIVNGSFINNLFIENSSIFVNMSNNGPGSGYGVFASSSAHVSINNSVIQMGSQSSFDVNAAVTGLYADTNATITNNKNQISVISMQGVNTFGILMFDDAFIHSINTDLNVIGLNGIGPNAQLIKQFNNSQIFFDGSFKCFLNGVNYSSNCH